MWKRSTMQKTPSSEKTIKNRKVFHIKKALPPPEETSKCDGGDPHKHTLKRTNSHSLSNPTKKLKLSSSNSDDSYTHVETLLGNKSPTSILVLLCSKNSIQSIIDTLLVENTIFETVVQFINNLSIPFASTLPHLSQDTTATHQ